MSEVPFGGGSDHAVFVDPLLGVPCPMLIQWPDRYYHSSHDTPDKCDPASLAHAARCAATFAGFLASAGAEELAWLATAVRRGSQRRTLAALDHADPARSLAAEELRARAALASLRRLDLPADLAATLDRAGEGAAQSPDASREPTLGPPQPPTTGEPGQRAIPARPPGPLEMQRHLIEGYGGLSREERERFRRLEAGTPDGTLVLDLAWSACDGARTIDEIAHLVWLETGNHVPGRIAEFFEWTARLGRSGWREGREGS
jgi:hypothetical protein